KKVCNDLPSQNISRSMMDELIDNVRYDIDQNQDLDLHIALELSKLVLERKLRRRPYRNDSLRSQLGSYDEISLGIDLLEQLTVRNATVDVSTMSNEQLEARVRSLVKNACIYSFCEYPRIMHMRSVESRKRYIACARSKCKVRNIYFNKCL